MCVLMKFHTSSPVYEYDQRADEIKMLTYEASLGNGLFKMADLKWSQKGLEKYNKTRTE